MAPPKLLDEFLDHHPDDEATQVIRAGAEAIIKAGERAGRGSQSYR